MFSKWRERFEKEVIAELTAKIPLYLFYIAERFNIAVDSLINELLFRIRRIYRALGFFGTFNRYLINIIEQFYVKNTLMSFVL